MTTSTSKLTKKYQATVPAEVRQFLGLQAGDSIAFEIDEGVVTVRKAQPVDTDYLRGVEATLSEWASPEDEEAYADL